MAYIPEDRDKQDYMDSLVVLDAKPMAKPKPKAAKSKPKKVATSSPRCVDVGCSTKRQATPTKTAQSPSNEAPAAHGDWGQTQHESQQLVT